ncbi:MAG: hypothetical protein DCF16_08620 [Alphaproteobacteria bacterium]|nr:MAG: hypothetical protein DCF16_08620 [Alphaproteobacteria bacterium]
MRRLLKFLHSVAAAGLMGGAAAMAIVLMFAPASIGDASYSAIVLGMSKLAAWVIGPSMALTVITGLLSMAVHPPFQDAGWVWVKAATGILVLQAGLHIIGPLQEEAARAARGLAIAADAAETARLFEAEINTAWVLLGVSVANIALGVWRPRFPQYPV